jgi:hypothetical protein
MTVKWVGHAKKPNYGPNSKLKDGFNWESIDA